MQIASIIGTKAVCTAKGVERDVSLFLLGEGEAKIGDFVMVHVGYAIQKMTTQEASTVWALFDEMLNA
jgi:hydrogenase expression/formation protein HypC